MKKFKTLNRFELSKIYAGNFIDLKKASPECNDTCKTNTDNDNDAAFHCAPGSACPTCSGGVCV